MCNLFGYVIDDQLNTTDDSKTVVPELIVKPIIHPFKDRDKKKVTEKDLKLLKKWVKIHDSIGYSVCDSVCDSVGYSDRDLSIWDSVWDLVYVSIGTSARNSIGAYISSFFKIKKWKYIEHKEYENPFQSGIDLWERGLVPSFDGKIWRLHGGKERKVLWEGRIQEIRKGKVK